ncbi:MAG: hypothetical protein IJ965_08360 [Campylobacter sp.]|nr:hypothetical protein [Campylobacter sp.]
MSPPAYELNGKLGDSNKSFSYHLYLRSVLQEAVDDNKLICVDLIDITNDGISSIYCFWDINYAYLSLGKYSLLNQILLAKAHKLPWIYLGFYVKNCESLEYKSDYKPYQILQEYTELDELAIWLDEI